MLRNLACAAGTAALLGLASESSAAAGDNPYLGDVMPVAFNFCPQGWARADGALLPISSHGALYSLMGTSFGGNGVTDFALPDLRGRFVVGFGQGLGLSNWTIGQVRGTETMTMTHVHLPAHRHEIQTSNGALTNSADGAMITERATGLNVYRENGALAPMEANVLDETGHQQLDLRSPSLAINWCIATTGLYPPRN